MRKVFQTGVPAILAVIVIFLSVQNRRLRLAEGKIISRNQRPLAGAAVPEVTIASLSGESVTIGSPPPGTRQLLMSFSASCEFCRASLPAWHTIIAAAAKAEVPTRVIGVALDSENVARSYVASEGLAFSATVRLPDRWWRLYRVTRVPTIILVETDGVTRYGRTGVLQPGPALDSVLAAIRRPWHTHSDSAATTAAAVAAGR